MLKALELAKLSNKLRLKEFGVNQKQKMFAETIIHKIFESNSSLYVKERNMEKV